MYVLANYRYIKSKYMATYTPFVGAIGNFLMCFSLYTNGYKILSAKQPPGSLTCINGIRFISMTWVILGHTVFLSTSSISK